MAKRRQFQRPFPGKNAIQTGASSRHQGRQRPRTGESRSLSDDGQNRRKSADREIPRKLRRDRIEGRSGLADHGAKHRRPDFDEAHHGRCDSRKDVACRWHQRGRKDHLTANAIAHARIRSGEIIFHRPRQNASDRPAETRRQKRIRSDRHSTEATRLARGGNRQPTLGSSVAGKKASLLCSQRRAGHQYGGAFQMGRGFVAGLGNEFGSRQADRKRSNQRARLCR